MRHGHSAILTGFMLLNAAVATVQSAPAPPEPSTVWPARVALTYNAVRSCPDLRYAGDQVEGVAVVLFHVGPTGVPSQPSIKSPSGSSDLDEAALSCVMRLRFDAATSIGDGVAIPSWQEIGWKWARPSQHAARAAPAASPTAPPAASTPGAQRGAAEVRACVDEAGKLLHGPTVVRSSGDPALDDAAVQIARSGSQHYRPASTADGQPTSGCVQLSVKFEGR